MEKNHKEKRGLSYWILIGLMACAVGIESGWDLSFSETSDQHVMTLVNASKLFPSATRIEENSDQSYSVFAQDKIGTAIITSPVQGYGGKIQLLIGLKDETVVNTVLLPNNETQEFLTYIKNEDQLGKWTGLPVKDVAHTRVDIVSGATTTSEAIVYAMHSGIAQVSGESVSKAGITVKSMVSDLLFLLVISMALTMRFSKKAKKYRTAFLITQVAVIGLLTAKVLSIQLLHGWLSNGVMWSSNWQSTLLLLIAAGMSLLKKPEFYCMYLCPMGGFQELVNKMSPFKRKNITVRPFSISLSEIYLTLIWAALIMGFTPELSHLEPFMAFSYKVASTGLFVFIFIVALLSLFFTKPWCAICPTGCLLTSVFSNRRKGSN